jgi:transposase
MDLPDEQWTVVEPLIGELPRRADGRGRPWRSSREVLNGILWILRAGAQWADLPERYPPYQTGQRRFQRWTRAGTLERICEALARDLKGRGKLDLAECFIDGTFVVAKKSLYCVSTSRQCGRLVEQSGIVGVARAQQVIDHPQEGMGEDGVGLLLGTTAVEETLVAHTPLGGAAGGNKGGEVEGMAQGTRSPLGEVLLPQERAALVRTGIKASVGHHRVNAPKSHDIAELGTDGCGALGANAGNVLQLLPRRVVLQQPSNRRFQRSDVRRKLLQLVRQRPCHHTEGRHGP